MRTHKIVLRLALVAAALLTSSSLRSASFVGNIAGTITNTSLAAIAGVTVTAYTPAGIVAGSAVTGGTGGYSISGLADGTYFVRTTNGLGYVDEVWDDIACIACYAPSTGFPVVVSGGPTIADFELAQGGTISGTVLGAGSPLVHSFPPTSVSVTIVDAGNSFVTAVSTIAGGGLYDPATAGRPVLRQGLDQSRLHQ